LGTIQSPCKQETQRSISLCSFEEGKIDPSFVVTHPASLEDAPAMYKKFRDKEDGVIKVVLRPG
jgi:threonine dehydrogenase-like Zn-dependent dehydrogenase